MYVKYNTRNIESMEFIMSWNSDICILNHPFVPMRLQKICDKYVFMWV